MSDQVVPPPVEGAKLVHHRCGYPLWAEVVTRIEHFPESGTFRLPDAGVVVAYRSAQEGTLPVMVWCCPGCGKPLKIWWSEPVEHN